MEAGWLLQAPPGPLPWEARQPLNLEPDVSSRICCLTLSESLDLPNLKESFFRGGDGRLEGLWEAGRKCSLKEAGVLEESWGCLQGMMPGALILPPEGSFLMGQSQQQNPHPERRKGVVPFYLKSILVCRAFYLVPKSV